MMFIVTIIGCVLLGLLLAPLLAGLVPVVLALLFVPLTVLAFAFWIWMLVHAILNKGLGDGEKIAWILVVFFGHFVGALIYFFVGRPKQITSMA